MLSPVNKISVMKYAHLMNRDMLLYYSFFLSKRWGFNSLWPYCWRGCTMEWKCPIILDYSL